jgi:hypothetical protein
LSQQERLGLYGVAQIHVIRIFHRRDEIILLGLGAAIVSFDRDGLVRDDDNGREHIVQMRRNAGGMCSCTARIRSTTGSNSVPPHRIDPFPHVRRAEHATSKRNLQHILQVGGPDANRRFVVQHAFFGTGMVEDFLAVKVVFGLQLSSTPESK